MYFYLRVLDHFCLFLLISPLLWWIGPEGRGATSVTSVCVNFFLNAILRSPPPSKIICKAYWKLLGAHWELLSIFLTLFQPFLRRYGSMTPTTPILSCATSQEGVKYYSKNSIYPTPSGSEVNLLLERSSTFRVPEWNYMFFISIIT